MALVDHQEADVTVTAVARVGSQVDADGDPGFVDRAKHPSWWSADVPLPGSATACAPWSSTIPGPSEAQRPRK